MMIKNKFLKVIMIILLLFFCVLLYSRFIGTSGLNVKEYKVTNTSLSSNFDGFKIVHLSDIHYGTIINLKRLEQIVEKVNMLKPDIVVITGDLTDRDTTIEENDISDIASCLSKINASIGKYAIRGNHDYEIASWEKIILQSDFINLEESYELIYKDGYEPILIAGLSSMQHEISVEERFNTLNSEIENLEENILYKILIIHEPDIIASINTTNYPLVLAGHSHNGQVRIPFIGAIIKPNGAKQYYDEYYQVNQSELYISSGIGTSELDFRLFNRPSFNLYRLTS